MNQREVFIANTKDQCRYKVVTDAATLGELQDVLTRNEGVFKKVGNDWVENTTPVDFSGMSFTEGTTKLTCVDRSSAIPEYGTRQGQLCPPVFLLTNTTKQISSGAVTVKDRSRKEAYAVIKEIGKAAQDDIKEIYGKNYTMVKTEDLWNWIDDNSEELPAEALEEVREELSKKVASKTTQAKAVHGDLVEVMYLGVKYMVNHNLITFDDAAALGDLVSELAARRKEEQLRITDKDIDDIIANL